VLASINLNDELLKWSAEIHNVFTDGILPAKMNTTQSVAEQVSP
jgi:hypothetical protein